ncbi:hypothetical protein Droror1_Dr00006138 [Drosera rotundifolia]
METELQPQKRSSSELPIKTKVFSQWTAMLDLFEISLNQSLIRYRRLDGGISLAARDKAVREFNSDPKASNHSLARTQRSLWLAQPEAP